MNFRCERCGLLSANDVETLYRSHRCKACKAAVVADDDPMADLGFECPTCHRTVPATASACPSCRTGAPPSRGRAVCPLCAIPLVERAEDGFVLDGCDGCGGVFLPHEVLDRWTEDRASNAPAAVTSQTPIAPEITVRYRNCPVCAETMRRTNFGGGSGIIVDVCERDGVWFDGGELEAAIDFARTGKFDARRLRAQRAVYVRPAESGAAADRPSYPIGRLTVGMLRLFNWR